MQFRSSLKMLLTTLIAVMTGCSSSTESGGGGEANFKPPRTINTADIALPPGYKIEKVASGLTFPTGIAFDSSQRIYVTEAGYSYGEVFITAKLLRLEPQGAPTVIATSDNGPWNGVVCDHNNFYVAEGGESRGGRILKIGMDGKVTALVENLPSFGDHHTDGPLVSPDGYVYFGQGTATNSGVVGPDDFKFGWLKRHPDFHDIPAKDIQLNGTNFTSDDPLHPGNKAITGAYLPYNIPSIQGQIIHGQIPCTGAILRVPVAGGPVELVAWGLRNPYGLALAPGGQLYVTENSYDVRGSRPVYGTGDLLWAITPGMWYGWPDYFGNEKLGDPDRFKAPGEPNPVPLLTNPPDAPPAPVAKFGVHSSADGFDFSSNPAFGHVGEAFVAEFGDMAPNVGHTIAPVGFRVVRVNVKNGDVEEFAANRGPVNGPASKLRAAGLERPLAARFNPAGDALYIVDFGVLTITGGSVQPRQHTGVIWKITRTGAP